MKDAESNDPLHGITLETILTRLVERYGWDGLGGMIDIRCVTIQQKKLSHFKKVLDTVFSRNFQKTPYLTNRHYMPF